MPHRVLNRFTGEIKFTAQLDCDESESVSFKLGLAVKWALQNGANLCEASLKCLGAEFRYHMSD